MKKILALLLFLVLPPSAIAQQANTETLQQKTDYIYLKDIEGKLGYLKIPGEVESVTRNHVLFFRQDVNATYLYTRDDVRRIELAGDDTESFGATVGSHWNDKDFPDLKSGDAWAIGGELISDYLPGAVVTGFLVLACVYFLASTLLQAYQRFVLEGNIKRLNTEKLLGEIDKLRIEVFEMRQRLGISTSAEEMLSREDEETPAGEPSVAVRGIPPVERRAVLPEMRLPETHIIEFVKTRILHIRSPEEFEARKQNLFGYWQTENAKNPDWFRLRYHAYNTAMTVAIWFGWIFALGLIGNVVGYFTDPSYAEIVGEDQTILFFSVICAVLIVAVIRLGQKRKLRRAAYRQVIDAGPSDG